MKLLHVCDDEEDGYVDTGGGVKVGLVEEVGAVTDQHHHHRRQAGRQHNTCH